MVWRRGIFPTTSSASLIPTAAIFGRRQLVILAASDPTYTRLSNVGDRVFPVAGSRLWKSLPPDVTSAPTQTVFSEPPQNLLFSPIIS